MTTHEQIKEAKKILDLQITINNLVAALNSIQGQTSMDRAFQIAADAVEEYKFHLTK